MPRWWKWRWMLDGAGGRELSGQRGAGADSRVGRDDAGVRQGLHYLQEQMEDPNPPIAEEFWGMGRSQQGIGAEEALWEGMRGPLRLELWAGGRLR